MTDPDLRAPFFMKPISSFSAKGDRPPHLLRALNEELSKVAATFLKVDPQTSPPRSGYLMGRPYNLRRIKGLVNARRFHRQGHEHAEEKFFYGSDRGQRLHVCRQSRRRIPCTDAVPIFPLGDALGFISELHFETKESGRNLDDLHLLLQNGSGNSRWSVSVKSNRQLSGQGLNGALVADLWADWNGLGGANFDQNSDLLGLITGNVGDGPLHDWEELREEAASTSPERVYTKARWSATDLRSKEEDICQSLSG